MTNTTLELIKRRYVEFANELKAKLTDEVKSSNPTLYYELLAIYNKYMSKSPYEPDINQDHN